MVKGQTLGTVISFKYLGAVVPRHGLISEVVSRIEQATEAATKWKPINGEITTYLLDQS